MTPVYAGSFAAYYDLFYGEKAFGAEAAFIDRLVRAEADGPCERLLDVACGTGQHAGLLAERGWVVLGVDQSDDMLQVARSRAAGKSVQFIRTDMRDLDLAESGFDAAVCLFDSIGYAVTNDAIVGTLTGIWRHLRPGGLFVLEFWHAAAMLCRYEPVREREWDTREGTIRRVSRTSLDVEHQMAVVNYELQLPTTDGRSETLTESHENRFFLVQEMSLFLEVAGFEPMRFFAGYDESRSIDVDTWHIVGLARSNPRARA